MARAEYKVCPRWQHGEDGKPGVTCFLEDIFTEIGSRPANHTIDRINNDGDYRQGNIKWSTIGEQNRNKRPICAEARAAKAEAMRRKWKDHEHRIARCVGISEGIRRKWEDPEHRAAMLERMSGERSPVTKLNWNQVNTICILARFESQSAVAKQFGISQASVKRIVGLQTWLPVTECDIEIARLLRKGGRKCDDPKYRAASSERLRSKWEDPEYRAVMSGGQSRKGAGA